MIESQTVSGDLKFYPSYTNYKMLKYTHKHMVGKTNWQKLQNGWVKKQKSAK